MNPVQAATQYCFGAISQIRQLEASSFQSPEVFQQKMCGFIDRMDEDLKRAGFDNQDIGDVKYAIVAFADEVALNAGEPISSQWVGNLLQMKYFQENTAGDGFFARLESIRRDPSRREILKVYALCLLFGFRGKYWVRGGELELMTLTESLQREVLRAKTDVEGLSPHGARPTEAIVNVKQNARLIIASAATLAFAILFYVWMRVDLSSKTSALLEQVGR